MVHGLKLDLPLQILGRYAAEFTNSSIVQKPAASLHSREPFMLIYIYIYICGTAAAVGMARHFAVEWIGCVSLTENS